MDLTPLFRVVVSKCQKDRGVVDDAKAPHRQRSANCNASVALFTKQCQSLLRELIDLEAYVQRYRDHTMALNSLYDLGSALTSNERLALNKLAINVIKSSELALSKLDSVRRKLPSSVGPNYRQHFEALVSLLRHLLCELNERHSSLNSQTYDRIVDLQRCCKLHNLCQSNRGAPRRQPISTRGSWTSTVAQHHDHQTDQGELEVLEQERQMVRRRLASQKRDVEQVEQKLGTLSELQRAFAENLLCQEESVFRISQSAVQSTDSVLESNKSIKKAMQRQKATRTWLMFVMLVLTFTLWFLHLYNP